MVCIRTKRASDSTDSEIVEAVMLATCAQLEYWMVTGESTSIQGNIKSATVGGFSVTFEEGSTKAVCTRTNQYLRDAGLLYRGVKVFGGDCYEDSIVYVESGLPG